MIPGGWEVHETISEGHMAYYNQIKDKLTNGQYTPLAVATQSVGGLNICFICKAYYQNNKEAFAKVLIRIPYSGEVEFQGAKEILL